MSTQSRAIGLGAAALGLMTLNPGALMAGDTIQHATHAHTNRLVDETSPYLLQHAHNPVEWHPWGEEAFEAARERGVPIFLSIGYSTCYWCHVMERESFENEAIASIMNEHFVCIKVDREERPDVDDIYMASVQLLSGRGGWPMSVWLTPPGTEGADDPGLKPFFAGTYFPAEAAHGRVAFPQLLENIGQAWKTQRDQIVTQSNNLTRAVQENFAARADGAAVSAQTVGQAVSTLLRIYDRDDAGFGRAPKFPQPVYLALLMSVVETIDDPAVQETTRRAIRHTLDRMATGGMYDQVGGGFHRYSTDGQWLVPHFEKMLYDNGQLASLYADSHRRWGDAFDARIVRDILEYVLREMTDESGAFYSAQDAEVDAREGLNYLWTRQEIAQVLGAEDTEFAIRLYGLDRGTNFQDPHHPGDARKNVLFMPQRPEAMAVQLNMTAEELSRRERDIDSRLYEARLEREQPGLDDKVITGWNGLMISGFADGAAALGEKKYLDVAVRAARTILEAMRDEQGQLMRTARNGRTKSRAFFEDYAMFISGLLSVHRAGEVMNEDVGDMLDAAIELTGAAESRFEDPDQPGLFYDALADQSDLIVRVRSTYDGAVPCGGSVMLHNYIDLFAFTGKSEYREKAIALLTTMSGSVSENPLATCNATRALHRLIGVDGDGVAAIGGEDVSAGAAVPAPNEPVKVFAPGERVSVPSAGAVTFEIRLEIDEGYHIVANDPGVEGLVPTTVRMEGATGINVAVRYPRGEELRIASLPEGEPAPRVYSGEIELQITMNRPDGEWTGRPVLLVAFQACTDQECLRPQLVELDLAIDKGE